MSIPSEIGKGAPGWITALNKLCFCWRVSTTPGSFLKLILNTKRKKGEGDTKARPGLQAIPDTPEAYSLRLHGQHRKIYLRTFRGDLSIFYDVFWRVVYRLPEKVFNDAAIIVDIGAHIGMTSLLFRMKAPQALVYAIEPDSANYDLLLLNLGKDIESGQLRPLNAAINDKNAPVYLQASSFSYNTAIVTEETAQSVPGITMRSFLQKNNIQSIDIFKIDIEGAEEFLFNDYEDWISVTGNILIEIHSDALLRRFMEIMDRYHFKVVETCYGYEKIYWASKVETLY